MNDLWIVVLPPTITALATGITWMRNRATRDPSTRDRARLLTVRGTLLTIVLAVSLLTWFKVHEPASTGEEEDIRTHTLDDTDRQAALIEYSAPGQTAGTRCESGTYFFYPVPPLR